MSAFQTCLKWMRCPVSVEDSDTSGEEGGAKAEKALMKHVRVHLGTSRQEQHA